MSRTVSLMWFIRIFAPLAGFLLLRSLDVQAWRLKLKADQLKPGYIEKICKTECVGFNVRN